MRSIAFGHAQRLVAAVLLVAVRTPCAGAASLFSAPQSFTTGIQPQAVAVGDVNDDGKPDLVVANVASSTISVLLGNGDGTFQPRTDYATGGRPVSVAVGDFNGDGRLDVATANDSTSDVSVLLGSGGGALGPRTDVSVGMHAECVAIGDVDADGKLDIVVAGYSQTLAILAGRGDGTFALRTDVRAGGSSYSVAYVAVIGDVNADGVADLVTLTDCTYGSSCRSTIVWVLLGDGQGAFAADTSFGAPQFTRSVTIADVNADGIADLAWSGYNLSGAYVVVTFGAGGGAFGSNTVLSAPYVAPSVTVTDVDRDGTPDIACTDGGGVSVWLGNGGAFGPRYDFPVGLLPNGLVASDLNADGYPDLVLVNNTFSNTVSVLLNTSATPTPTLLARFDAEPGAGGIEIHWSFVGPTVATSVAVERARSAAGPWSPLPPESIDSIAGTAFDANVDPDLTTFYRLRVTLADGSQATFGPISSAQPAVSASTALLLVAPNPLRNGAKLRYRVGRSGRVRVTVVDVAGRVLSVVFDGTSGAGVYELAWDGRIGGHSVPRGLYFIRLSAPDRTVTRTLAALR